MAPTTRKRAAETCASQGDARSSKSRRMNKQGKEKAESSQATAEQNKKNEEPGFKWGRDIKGTEYEGCTMTLGPREYDSGDKLQISSRRGGKRVQDTSSMSESGETIESEATGPADVIRGGAASSAGKDQEYEGDGTVPMDKKDPYDYILMARPREDFEEENRKKPESKQLSEDDIFELCKKEFESIPHDTAASTKPDHKWILMRGAWIKFADTMRERSYRSPNALGMYIYNDFEGYGIFELAENLVQAFSTEYAKKNSNIKDMWIPLVTLPHFLLVGDTMLMGHIDDGERVAEFITLIGRAYLAMLNALDRADQLGPESDFKDLALVSGLYTTIPDLFPDSYDDEKLDWRQYVGDYMEASRIDISFVYGSLKLKTGGKVKDLNGRKGIPKAGADRWGFKSALTMYKRDYSVGGKLIGGTRYDITKMSRTERAHYAFDKKDPLKAVSAKDLRDGNLMFC